MMVRFIRFAVPGLLLGSLVFLAGCGNSGSNGQARSGKDGQVNAPTAPDSNKQAGAAPSPGEEHGHKPGQHGGIMVSIGRDNYHAEAIFEKGGLLRLYTLGQDESRVLEVERQTLTAYVKTEGDAEAEQFELQPLPQPGDAADKTSQFLGKLPAQFAGKRVEVTIPSMRIGGERFRVGFKSVTETHQEAGMPAKVSDDEERKLYLTAGGKYTAEDVKANGNVTASQKFKGLMASHDMRPKAGEKICPITFTKANPKFTWVVGGKTYEFCCPPCVDEFVKLAKESPKEVKEPEEYRKQ